MNTYLILVHSPDQAKRAEKRITDAVKAGTATAERHGVIIRNVYWTVTTYEAVLIAEACDEKVIGGWVDSLDNLRARLIPTLSEDEFEGMFAGTWALALLSCETIQWSY